MILIRFGDSRGRELFPLKPQDESKTFGKSRSPRLIGAAHDKIHRIACVNAHECACENSYGIAGEKQPLGGGGGA